VLVPIINSKDEDPKLIYEAIEDVYQRLKVAGVRVHLDDRDNYNPGWKFNHWEVKGVPIRIELGKKDLVS
jgi:prolyl-tRNA synthetase